MHPFHLRNPFRARHERRERLFPSVPCHSSVHSCAHCRKIGRDEIPQVSNTSILRSIFSVAEGRLECGLPRLLLQLHLDLPRLLSLPLSQRSLQLPRRSSRLRQATIPTITPLSAFPHPLTQTPLPETPPRLHLGLLRTSLSHLHLRHRLSPHRPCPALACPGILPA